MDAELKSRAEKVAALSQSSTRFTSEQLAEIGAVHFELTGNKVGCVSCNVYGLISRVSNYLLPKPLKTKKMAIKGHFKAGAPSTQIIRHTKTGTILITPETLNEKDNFEYALAKFPHLVEAAAKKEEKAEPVQEIAERLEIKQGPERLEVAPVKSKGKGKKRK